MATPVPHCSQKASNPTWRQTQFEVYSQWQGGKFGLTGETVVVPATDIVDASPVNWTPVGKVQPSRYIDYRGIIMNERTPDLFPPAQGMPNFIGAIYTYSAGGEPLLAPRLVFLDAAEPSKLVMRVPQSADDEDKVVSYYSWSRTNFVYQKKGWRWRKFIFQLFTPANLGTHGATVTDGVPLFTALPQGTRVEDKFTYFQIKGGQNQDHITDEKESLGLYVDKSDGWKVKATPETSLWDKFKITSFTPPEPIFGSDTSKYYQCAPEMYRGKHVHWCVLYQD